MFEHTRSGKLAYFLFSDMVIFNVVVYQNLIEDEVLLFDSEGAIGLSFLVGPPGAAQSLPNSTTYFDNTTQLQLH